MGRFDGRVRLAATTMGEETWSTARVWPRSLGRTGYVGNYVPVVARTVSASRIANEWVETLRREGRTPILRVDGEYLVVSAN